MFAYEFTIENENTKADVWSPLVGSVKYQTVMPHDYNKIINSKPVLTKMSELVGEFSVIAVIDESSAKGFSTVEEAFWDIQSNELYKKDKNAD